MSERLPDNAWHDGQVASWEGKRSGYRALFEVIADPSTFVEVGSSAGDDELIELFEPSDGHTLVIRYLDEQENPIDQEPTVLNSENPVVILPQDTHYELDATASTEGNLAYTCVLYGLEPLVD